MRRTILGLSLLPLLDPRRLLRQTHELNSHQKDGYYVVPSPADKAQGSFNNTQGDIYGLVLDFSICV